MYPEADTSHDLLSARREKIAADWRVEVTARLLTEATDTPELQYPVLHAAIGLGIPLTLFPRKSLTWIGSFLQGTKPTKRRTSGRSERELFVNTLLGDIIQSATLFGKKGSAHLLDRITSDPGLLQTALKHPNFFRFPNARTICINALDHKASGVANSAIELLLQHWPEEVEQQIDMLVKKARSPSRFLRQSVATALGFSNSSIAEARVKRLLADPERIVRKAAVASLVRIKGVEAASEVGLCLKDPAPLVRIEACRQVAILKEVSLVKDLIERGSDVSSAVRRAALYGLEQIDRDLALRNFSAFAKGDYAVERRTRGNHTANPQVSDDADDQVSDDADPETGYTYDPIDELEMSNKIDAKTIDALRRIVFAKELVKDALISGREDLLESQSIDDEGSPAQLLNSIMAAVKRPWTLTTVINHLIKISSPDEATQAFLIAFMGFVHLEGSVPSEWTRRLRRHGIDDIFRTVVRVYGPGPKSLHWPVSRETLGDYPPSDEDDDWFDAEDLSLAEELQGDLLNWALFRAQPEHLGFVLACSGPTVWRQIPLRFELSAESSMLTQRYGSLATKEDVIVEIQRKWFARELSSDSPEVILLAGMGDRGMELVGNYGQRILFESQSD